MRTNRHSLQLSMLFILLVNLTCVSHGWSLTLDESGAAEELERGFVDPPKNARPWVYYFIMDGNLTKQGITADLEAMQRVGIGGLLMMEVDVGIPRGPVKFMSPEWRDLFKHLNREAARLGLQVTMNASGGWTGSGGPWIRPEQSMQKLVTSELQLTGPQLYDAELPQPETVEGFYRDVAVLAFPTPKDPHKIKNIAEKAVYHRGHFSSEPGVRTLVEMPRNFAELRSNQVLSRRQMVDISEWLNAAGKLTWQVPTGDWTVMRIGHTSTGMNTRPAPKAGLGLECDKFDRKALDAHFENFLGALISDIGPLTGRSLVATHIDSWEMQAQNWTANFAAEFRRRRGYDPLYFLPVMSGCVVENLETSERFLWDLRQTILELISENYSGYLAELAHARGLRLSIEPNDGTPCDDMTYGSRADVPMCEFWSHGFDTWYSVVEATSTAHVYGKRVVQAEAFTAIPGRAWMQFPGSLKSLADYAYCEGINRFVIHRYAHQPWLDRLPGMTMGPYGVHCERTQTWWGQSSGWWQYMARCQFMLQQGLFVADYCYLTPEASPQVFHPLASGSEENPTGRFGYNFDGCTPEALLTRMQVADGRLQLPDGMSYRALVLPQVAAMTPRLLTRIKELAEAGATIVVGPRPTYSPSLEDFPRCDQQVQQLVEETWPEISLPGAIAERPLGSGRVIGVGTTSRPAEASSLSLEGASWIWRADGQPAVSAQPGDCYFRRLIELPTDRTIQSAQMLMTADNSFELFVNGQAAGTGATFRAAFLLNIKPWLKPGKNVLAVIAGNGAMDPNPAGLIGRLQIQFSDGSEFSLITDDQWQSTLATEDGWKTSFDASDPWRPSLVLGPAGMSPWGAVQIPEPQPEVYFDASAITCVFQHLGVPLDFESNVPLRYIHRRTEQADVYFVANRRDESVTAECKFRVVGKAPEIWDPVSGRRWDAREYRQENEMTVLPLEFHPSGALFIVFRTPAEATRNVGANFPARKSIAAIDGQWRVSFDPNMGGPENVVFSQLMDWTTHSEPGVKYYSGAASYKKVFHVPAAVVANRDGLRLALGDVEVMAHVVLNGDDLGIVWTRPFSVDVSQSLRPGENELQIQVVNLWPNRLAGDSLLPADQRYTWTTVNPYDQHTSLLPSGLLGPVTLEREVWTD